MARPSDKYEPKKKELEQVALDLFIKSSYEDITISQITKAAGLSKAGMYHYFSSKEEVLDAAIQSIVEQDIINLRNTMQGLCAEAKMICFIKGNAVPSNLMRKLLGIKQDADSSYAAYRIREQTVHANIPVLEKILEEGIAQGVYSVAYPLQTAEFLVLLGKSLVEIHILPAANLEGTQARVFTFVQLIERWLNPSQKHLASIQSILLEETAKGELNEKEQRS
jgi:AcrR family transcriptional regulator